MLGLCYQTLWRECVNFVVSYPRPHRPTSVVTLHWYALHTWPCKWKQKDEITADWPSFFLFVSQFPTRLILCTHYIWEMCRVGNIIMLLFAQTKLLDNYYYSTSILVIIIYFIIIIYKILRYHLESEKSCHSDLYVYENHILHQLIHKWDFLMGYSKTCRTQNSILYWRQCSYFQRLFRWSFRKTKGEQFSLFEPLFDRRCK